MATLVDNWSASESVLKNPLNSSEESMISFVDGAPSTVRLGEMSRIEDINGTTVMEKLEGVISVGVGEMEGEARMSWELNGWVSLMLVVVWRGRGEEGRGVPFSRSSGDTLLDSIIPRERYIKQTITKMTTHRLEQWNGAADLWLLVLASCLSGSDSGSEDSITNESFCLSFSHCLPHCPPNDPYNTNDSPFSLCFAATHSKDKQT